MRFLSVHHVHRSRAQLAGLAALVATLSIAGAVGMAYVAGFDAVRHRLAHAHWWWLALSFGAVLVSFAGYFFGYRGIKFAEEGPKLDRRSVLAVVTANFGGFLAHGGTALDQFAMRAGGADKREANIRVGALGAFEHGVLALIVCPASIAALLTGVVVPRTSFTWPWAIIPPPAFLVGILLAERYRGRLRGRGGWREGLATFFDTTHLIYAVLTKPRRHGLAVAGMALFWGADMLALWAATAAFRFQMSALSVIVALGTGMIFTRRTAPLAGAGLMTVALVPTLWFGAAVPLAPATLGVVVYRLFTLWVPLPAALLAIPRLRQLRRAGEDGAERESHLDRGQPALEL